MKALKKNFFYSFVGISYLAAIIATWFLCRLAISWQSILPEAWQSGSWPLCMSCLFFIYAYVVDRYCSNWKRRLLWVALYVGIAYGAMELTAVITLNQIQDWTVPLGWGFSQIFAALFGFFLVIGALYTPKTKKSLPEQNRVWMLVMFAALSVIAFIWLPLFCHATLPHSYDYGITIPIQLAFNVLMICLTVQCKRSLCRPWIGYLTIIGILFAYLAFAYVTADLVDNGILTVMPLAYFRDTNITANAYLAVPTVLATILFLENRYES